MNSICSTRNFIKKYSFKYLKFNIRWFSLFKEDPGKKKTSMSDFNKYFLTKQDEDNTQIQNLQNLPALSKYIP
jgi:hypothetical protein